MNPGEKIAVDSPNGGVVIEGTGDPEGGEGTEGTEGAEKEKEPDEVRPDSYYNLDKSYANPPGGETPKNPFESSFSDVLGAVGKGASHLSKFAPAMYNLA